MKRIWFAIIVLLSISLAFSSAMGREKVKGHKGKKFLGEQLIVKFSDTATQADRNRVRRQLSGLKGRKLKRSGLEKIHLPAWMDEEWAVGVLGRDPSVEYVDLNYTIEFLESPVMLSIMPTLVPSDLSLGQHWHLDAQPVEGTFANAGTVYVDVDIDAPEGWAVMNAAFSLSTTAAVGVLDSGCGEAGAFSPSVGYIPGHVDLPNSSLFANTVELVLIGDDSLSDVNLYQDDVNGYDFVQNDNVPQDVDCAPAPDCARFHGTLISGILAGEWDNGVGVSGIGAGYLKVLPMRLFGGGSFEVVEAVEYAMDLEDDGHEIQVLNMSFKEANGNDFTGLKKIVGDAALSPYGIAVVAAGGNDSDLYSPYTEPHNNTGELLIRNNDDFIDRVWPAEYTREALNNVLAVGATGTDGSLADFSNIGPSSIQIAAPGVNIRSTFGGTNQYALASGSSFSTPIAGAVLGLVMAAHPGMLPAEAIDRVLDGGDFDARLAGLVISGKRVNLAGALAPFYPYSGLAYLDSTITVGMYNDTISTSYGSILSADIDMAWSTSPKAADMVGAPSSTLTLTPTAPGIAQFTLYFSGASAPVGTYDTGPWRVTAIRPFTAQIREGDSVTFQSLLPAVAASVSWAISDTTVASITKAGNGDGVLSGLQEGIVRVVLSVDGVERDYSGQVLVLPPLASSNGGRGGCGITSSPGDPYIPGLVEMMLMGTILMLIRRRYRTALVDPRSKVQDPRRG